MKSKEREFNIIVRKYDSGQINRRGFMQSMTALGVSVTVANILQAARAIKLRSPLHRIRPVITG